MRGPSLFVVRGVTHQTFQVRVGCSVGGDEGVDGVVFGGPMRDESGMAAIFMVLGNQGNRVILVGGTCGDGQGMKQAVCELQQAVQNATSVDPLLPNLVTMKASYLFRFGSNTEQLRRIGLRPWVGPPPALSAAPPLPRLSASEAQELNRASARGDVAAWCARTLTGGAQPMIFLAPRGSWSSAVNTHARRLPKQPLPTGRLEAHPRAPRARDGCRAARRAKSGPYVRDSRPSRDC